MNAGHRDDDEIVELTRVPTRFEADAIATDLRTNGVTATVVPADGWLPHMTMWQGNRVLVFRSELDAAREILAGESIGVTSPLEVGLRALEPRDALGCDAVVATLPGFFGLETGIEACAQAVRSERGVVAVDGADDVLGFATWMNHRPHAAEITWAAVKAAERNRGIGRRIVREVESLAAATGTEWMTVLTLSPNDPEASTYAPTRHFWHTVGYTELCDLDIWDVNLAVILAKRLETG
ncbi:MAG: GCN5-related N-acetyltransferase [Actinomycetia bacterium]|jgi:ribosomal protein S18 acetylase RimI-like enzyme|nr:GCN5-related N-acetyltransferase [Actinomycetes bacterium]